MPATTADVAGRCVRDASQGECAVNGLHLREGAGSRLHLRRVAYGCAVLSRGREAHTREGDTVRVSVFRTVTVLGRSRLVVPAWPARRDARDNICQRLLCFPSAPVPL